jgi:hypothetical protein
MKLQIASATRKQCPRRTSDSGETDACASAAGRGQKKWVMPKTVPLSRAPLTMP